MNTIKCCICGKSIQLSQSHDPHPLSSSGRCCSECNYSKVLTLRKSLSMNEELKVKYSRILEIQDEVANCPKPKLGEHSLEDWDDIAQSRLEWNWWRDEIQEEYDSLTTELGIIDKLKFIY